MRYIIKSVLNKSYISRAVYLLLALLLYGCLPASMSMSKQDVQRLKPSEGVVVGSLLAEIGLPYQQPRFPLIKSKMEAEKYKYVCYAKKKNGGFFGIYEVITLPGKEKIFVTKLEEGEYLFYEMDAYRKIDRLESDIDVRFVVAPGKTTYIGRLIITVPEKLWRGVRYNIRIEDAQDKTIEAIKEKYADEVKEVTKDLMRIQ